MDKIITNLKSLSVVSRETDIAEVQALDLVHRLRAANDTAWTKGVGLAAIQIGIPLRFAWFKWGEEEFTLLNPEIILTKGKLKHCTEGCLSIPNKYFAVRRWYKIQYTLGDDKSGFFRNRVFTAKGLKAEIIQHEVDHMNGILVSSWGKERG